MKVPNRFTNETLGEFDISPKSNLGRANLGRANLREANLDGADLGGADLGGADLGRANLRGADLGRANLDGANLDGANLDGAYLRGADLGGANLRGAYLGGANLDGAYLDGADLRKAYLGGANLDGADLREAKYNLLQVFSIRISDDISDELCLELMRHDAIAHPYPKKFQEWAQGGECPLNSAGILRMFGFAEKRELFQPGPPTVYGWQLWQWIARELEIKI